MIQVDAFCALRPRQDMAYQVAALPYDVMSREEAKKYMEAKGGMYSFIQIDKPKLLKESASDEEIYQLAGEKLDEWIRQGIYIQEDQPSMYIYVLTSPWTTQYGLVGLVQCKDYNEGKIKKHESTREAKEKDRVRHIEGCKAHTGPIFLTAENIGNLELWMKAYVKDVEALYDFKTEDGIRHQVYRIEKPEHLNEIQTIFSSVERLYIADGHHRSAAACTYGKTHPELTEAQRFLGVIFPKDQLHIMSYNRVVKDISGLNEEEVFNQIENHFKMTCKEDKVVVPNKPHVFGMYYRSQWYELELKGSILNKRSKVQRLDVALLQDLVLEPIFKVLHPREDAHIDFIGGIRGVEGLYERIGKDMDIAFTLYPTSIEELIEVADYNQMMPPKSTWFEPKLLSGLWIHRIDS